ncbi:MAG: hypothetical protein HYS17_08100 [Micavibrio aeruginosavorus]|uniref:GGDEF domain-containing protein n=1 Tax=Micavibrio aeruginosavorus TaxID=349221 RepID=A0A7T5UHD3_9BACT|nr:MAG: hypothetical protein HYS17_08100 [Micavibrio aeruginosavorus]
MGKRWDGLCAVVYDTVEDVIIEHIGKNDLFVRYADDTYVIIFAYANLEEGKAKADAIAEEVRRRLFLLDEEELREIEVKKAVRELTADTLSRFDFPDFLGEYVDDSSEPVVNSVLEENQEDDYEAMGAAVEIEAHDYKPQSKQDVARYLSNIKFSYMPLWDVRRAALTAYMCLAEDARGVATLLEGHKSVYAHLDSGGRVAADIQLLQHVMSELALMVEDGRKFLIVCPVCYETLFNFESYESYKECLESIPLQQRQFLVLLILKPEKQLNAKDAYWFLPAIKKYSRLFFAEVPLKQGIYFQSLKAIGLDGVGVILDKHVEEKQAIGILGGFSNTAKSHKIPLTFVMGVSSLSLTTSSVCAGFDYIGGPAVHDSVAKPDAIHKYKHENIVSALMSKQG